MATNITTTIKRYNNTDWDTLHPATTQAQVSGLVTALAGKLSTSLKGSANGLAELDSNGKVPETQLPSSVFGGMRFVDAIASDTNFASLLTLVESYVTANGGSHESCYFIVGGERLISSSTNHIFKAGGGEEGDGTGDITLESGDWLVLVGYDAGTPSYSWAIVNNTYQNATTTVKGIVELATQAEVDAGTAGKVVTADTLADRLNDFSTTSHNHDSDYLGITANAVSASKWATARSITLSGDASGSVSIDGSSNVTLSVAVADDSHDHLSGQIDFDGTSLDYMQYTGNGTATLNQILSTIDSELGAVDTSLSNLSGRVEVFYSTSTPTGVKLNDIWLDA